MSESGGLCRNCIKFFLGVGLAALVIWLTFRPIKPRYYLVAFSLSNAAMLNSTRGAGTTTVASFQLEIENKNKNLGIYHDAISLSLFSYNGTLTAPLGNTSLIPSFYQGHQKTAEKTGNVTGGHGVAVKNGTARLRVGVESAFRYKLFAWKTRHHKVRVAGDVAVDSEGKKTATKGIRLCSAAPPPGSVVPIVFLVYVLFAWC